MAKFRYLAKINPKEIIEESMEAENREAVLHFLLSKGYVPVQIQPETGAGEPSKWSLPGFKKRIPLKARQAFIRQFASLIRFRVPIVRSLSVLEDQAQHARFKEVIHNLTDSIQREGKTLSDAMKNYPEVFSADTVSLIQAGEVGGMLEQVLDKLSEKIEKEQSLRSKITSALIYPLFVAAFGVLTVIFLLTFVMPRILKVISNFGADLPIPTKILLALTHWMTLWGFWIAAAFVSISGFLLLRAIVIRNRLWVDQLLTRFPILGKLILHLEFGRFCRSLGLLLDHGVLILPALETAIQVVRNRYFQEQLGKLPAAVKEGHSISQGLRQISISNSFLLNTVAIGEEGGKVGEALMEASNYYEEEAFRITQILAGFLEPLVILIIGAFIGFIVMAVLLPIFNISGIVH